MSAAQAAQAPRTIGGVTDAELAAHAALARTDAEMEAQGYRKVERFGRTSWER
jgi:hypothetical protein